MVSDVPAQYCLVFYAHRLESWVDLLVDGPSLKRIMTSLDFREFCLSQLVCAYADGQKSWSTMASSKLHDICFVQPLWYYVFVHDRAQLSPVSLVVAGLKLDISDELFPHLGKFEIHLVPEIRAQHTGHAAGSQLALHQRMNGQGHWLVKL